MKVTKEVRELQSDSDSDSDSSFIELVARKLKIKKWMFGGFTQWDSGVKPVISRSGTRAETRVMELLSSELGTFTIDIDIDKVCFWLFNKQNNGLH